MNETFYNRLRRICKGKDTTVSKMLESLDMSSGCTGAWSHGSIPKGDVLIKISEYLNVSIDYLLLGYEYNEISKTEKELIKEIRKSKNKENLIQLLKSIVIYENSKTLREIK